MKKRLLKGLIFAAILTLGFSVVTIASFATNADNEELGEKEVVLQDTVLVKCDPTSLGVVKGLLIKGTKVTVTGEIDGGWYNVAADELDGWFYGFRMGDELADGNTITEEEIELYEQEVARENLAENIIDNAKSYLGCPYRYGATGPSSFDCSGLLYRVFGDNGVSVPRSSRAYGSYGKTVSLKDAVPGDVIVFATGGRIHHVGIYIGDDKFIHSACSTGVSITSVYDKYWQPKIYRVTRIL